MSLQVTNHTIPATETFKVNNGFQMISLYNCIMQEGLCSLNPACDVTSQDYDSKWRQHATSYQNIFSILSILLCLTSGDFTRQWETPRRERVKRFGNRNVMRWEDLRNGIY